MIYPIFEFAKINYNKKRINKTGRPSADIRIHSKVQTNGQTSFQKSVI